MSTQPTYDQLVTLPAYAVQPVPSAFEDSNGFLNVRHYLGMTRTNRNGVAYYVVPHLKSGKRYGFSAWLANFSVPEAFAKTAHVRVQ